MSTAEPNELAEQIGHRVRTWRQATPAPKTRPARAGGGGSPDSMTVEELADAAGMGRDGVNRIELGQRLPTIPSLYAIAQALGCSMAELLPPARTNPKAEALAELQAAAAQLQPQVIKRIARQVKALRGEGGEVLT